MKIGIVGLPNAGKTTIFNALCSGHAKVEKYPFTTVNPNIGTVDVPDSRLLDIAGIYKPERVVHTTINFIDIAGLVKGASNGEGLGNQFLGNIREVDSIVHVVRFFKDPEVPHSYGDIDPERDMEIINTELMLADLAIAEKNLKGSRIEGFLKQGKMLNTAELSEDEKILARQYGLLTAKPVLYVANVDEPSPFYPEEKLRSQKGLGEPSPFYPEEKLRSQKGLGEAGKSELITISGKWESELADLDEESRKEFVTDELGLAKLIRAGYASLGLITFFTTESKEVKAWTVRSGAKAPEAAGKIHTDMERGFIKAEVIPYAVLMKWKDPHKAKEHGEVKFEGREYIVQDGDIIKFHFN